LAELHHGGEFLKVNGALENYLETILILQGEQGKIRSVDVANRMRYSKPTVSVAMRQLRENGLVEVDDGGHIALTAAGEDVAKKTYERHMVIAQLLIRLGVDERTAYDDACKIEHAISEESFRRIKAYYNELFREEDCCEPSADTV